MLHGKEVALPKPLAVLEKKTDSTDETTDKSSVETEYIVKAIVKKKLIFRSRPKPIITNVPKCN